ncbi:hypothetical protein ACWEOE_36840 [Amycolatopsis sp. NPDC004368]
MKIKYGLLLTTMAAVVSLSACASSDHSGSKVASANGSGDQTSTTAVAGTGDDEFTYDEQVAFAKCMREHGLDMPDPDPKSGGVAAGPAGETQDLDKVNKANEACRHLLPNGGEVKPPSAEQLDKMRQQATCLRERGIDAKDPDSAHPNVQLPPITFGDEKTNEALKTCGLIAAGSAPVPVG